MSFMNQSETSFPLTFIFKTMKKSISDLELQSSSFSAIHSELDNQTLLTLFMSPIPKPLSKLVYHFVTTIPFFKRKPSKVLKISIFRMLTLRNRFFLVSNLEFTFLAN